MQLNGEAEIRAPRADVWAALNDPAVLSRCIEGVEQLDRDGENRFAGTMNAKVGPVKARFSGAIELTEIEPLQGYVLVGEGKGGVAGFARGRADVRLADLPDGGTRLSYSVESQVGGKLAQLGTRLIEGTARSYAERFFAALKAELEAAAPPAQAQEAAAPSADDVRGAATAAAVGAVTSPARGLPAWAWIGGLVLLVLSLLALLAA